jgi:DNA-binding GntR family transcriptional regulator
MALAHFDLEEAIDTRIQLEGYAAVRAAARAPDAELERMAKLVEKMANPSLSADAVHALAEEFHVAIVDASGNKLASFLLQGLLKAGVQREMVLASEKLPEWETLVSRVCGEHVVILEKIRCGDGAAAAELLESHIRHFYKDVVGADAGRRPSESPPEP